MASAGLHSPGVLGGDVDLVTDMHFFVCPAGNASHNVQCLTQAERFWLPACAGMVNAG